MNNEFINQFNDSSKASFETFQQLNAISVETIKKLAALQFNLTTLNVDSTVEQARLLAGGKDPQALFTAESAFAKTYGEKLMQISSETTAVLTQSREELLAFANKSLKNANVQNVSTATAAKKPVAKKTAKKAVKKAA